MTNQYAEREKRFNDSLPGTVGAFMLAVSLADGEARKNAVAITKQILEMPNIEISQKLALLDSPDPLVYSRTLPAVTYAEPRPFLAEEATLAMSMTVSASTVEENSLDVATEASGSARIGFGLWSASMSMKANVSKHSSGKRSSDYSATTDMNLKMVRHPLPEGLAKTLDSMNAQAAAIDEINLALARRKIDEIANSGAQLPEAPKDNGSGRDDVGMTP